jgi:alkylation response protein AidB-like acyl-CoA dehydrogenase
MDFTLTDDQELLRSTARRLLAGECPPSVVRAHMEDRGAARALWGHLAGWTALAAGPLTDLCLFLEETGAALAPGPFFATTVLWQPLAVAVGEDPERVGTVAMAGADGVWQVNGDAVRTFVLDADLAERVAFVLPGPAVAVVDATELAPREVTTLDPSRPVFEIRVPDGVIGVAVQAEVVEDLLERAWVALAAELLGTARWLFDASLAYAKSRVQFDRPIGSFQAIQHKLADMALAVERAWAATYYAAMAIDAGDAERHRAAHVAKAAAGAAARRAAKDGIQIHGGIGFTWEHDLHLWMRRAFTSERLLGPTAWHHDRLADLLLV